VKRCLPLTSITLSDAPHEAGAGETEVKVREGLNFVIPGQAIREAGHRKPLQVALP